MTSPTINMLLAGLSIGWRLLNRIQGLSATMLALPAPPPASQVIQPLPAAPPLTPLSVHQRFCGDVSPPPPSTGGERGREARRGALGRGVEKQGGRVSDSVGKVGERGGGERGSEVWRGGWKGKTGRERARASRDAAEECEEAERGKE